MMPSRPDSREANGAIANHPQYITDSEDDVESLNGSFPDNEIESLDDSTVAGQTDFQHRQTTPPAALWLRGSAANMDEHNVFSPSTVSISDEYEIVDDAETASLSSSTNEADMTESTQDDRLLDRTVSRTTFDQRLRLAEADESRQEHDLYDSMLSEDIETPRQSLWTSGRYPATLDSSNFLRRLLVDRPLHVMYFALPREDKEKEELLFKTIASHLSGAGVENVRHAQLIELPDRPNGRFDGTDAVYRSGFVDLHLLRIASDEQVALERLVSSNNADLAVIYVANYPGAVSWITNFLDTFANGAVPALIVTQGSAEKYQSMSDPNGVPRNVLSEDTLLHESAHGFSSRLNTILVAEEGDAIHEPAQSIDEPKVLATKQTRRRGVSATAPVLILSLLLSLFFAITGYNPISVSSYAERHNSLSAQIDDHLGVNRSQTLNITHLLHPTSQTRDYSLSPLSREPQVSQQATFVLAEPNHILVSMPRLSSWNVYPKVLTIQVEKGSAEVAHNYSRLIDGVYCIDIDSSKAHGSIKVRILAKSPMLDLTVDANFGHNVLRRAVIDKARSDLSVAVKKDLIVVQNNARALKTAVQADLQSGLSVAKEATDLITSQALAEMHTIFAGKFDQIEELYRAGVDLVRVRTQKSIMNLDVRTRAMVRSLEDRCKQVAKVFVPSDAISLARERVLAIKKVRKPLRKRIRGTAGNRRCERLN